MRGAPICTTFHAADVVPDALINVFSTVSGVIEGDEPSVRVAFIDDDEATLLAESTESPEAEPSLAECVVYTGKISQLIRVSREQCYQEGTAEQLSQSVARALVKKADQAFINQAAPTPRANGPARGLLNVMGVVNGGAVASDLDTLVDVVAELQSNGGTPTHIVGPARLG